MARTRRRQPYDPGKIHDRRSTDKLKDAQLAPQEVDDPFEIGAKIIVMRSTRDDPLAGLHARNQVDGAQYEAGRTFQRYFEAAERGPCAIDPSKEAVDGGRMPEPITEQQRLSATRLAAAHRKLGEDRSAIVHDVLIHSRTFPSISQMRGLSGRKWDDYFSDKFRESLDILAELWGLSNGQRPS